MSQHTYIRLTGYALTVTPRSPFRIERTEGIPQAIDVEYDSPEGLLFARVVPHEGGYRSQIDQHTPSLREVLDVDVGTIGADWRIETTVFSCAWPVGYVLCSTNFPVDPGPFDLLGPHGEMIFVQCPQQLPALAEMVAPGQKVVHIEQGTLGEWIELSYTHEDEAWLQRHEIKRLQGHTFVITMQTPMSFSAAAIQAAQELTATLQVYRG